MPHMWEPWGHLWHLWLCLSALKYEKCSKEARVGTVDSGFRDGPLGDAKRSRQVEWGGCRGLLSPLHSFIHCVSQELWLFLTVLHVCKSGNPQALPGLGSGLLFNGTVLSHRDIKAEHACAPLNCLALPTLPPFYCDRTTFSHNSQP